MESPSLRTDTLFIVGSNPVDRLGILLAQDTPPEIASVILVQDAVTANDVPIPSVHVLDEDLHRRHATSRFPSISYSGMLQMIFNAKRVVVL